MLAAPLLADSDPRVGVDCRGGESVARLAGGCLGGGFLPNRDAKDSALEPTVARPVLFLLGVPASRDVSEATMDLGAELPDAVLLLTYVADFCPPIGDPTSAILDDGSSIASRSAVSVPLRSIE